jgi:hypothetical protein
LKYLSKALWALPRDPALIRLSIFSIRYKGKVSWSSLAVVTVVEGNELRVVGVHVAVHGDSAEDIDEESISSGQASQLATRRQLSDALTTLSQESHGRSTFAMICDVARVSGLLKFLENHKQMKVSNDVLAGKKRKQRN